MQKHQRTPKVETLETRRVLANWSGTISENTNWNDTSEPYVITGDLTIASDVTLNIGPGVQVSAANSVYDIFVSGNLNLDGVTFSGSNNQINVRDGGKLDMSSTTVAGNFISFESGSRGTVQNSTFGSARLFLASDSVSISNTNFSLAAPVRSRPILTSVTTGKLLPWTRFESSISSLD